LAGIKKFFEINHATMLIEQLNHALYYLTKFYIYVRKLWADAEH
jgi:hypothetical protein